jgi:hypothetical protein
MTSSLLRAPFRAGHYDFDTDCPTQPQANAPWDRPVTVSLVSATATHETTATVLADHDTFLDIEDVAARYGIGRTKAYELLRSEGFPGTVVPGMVRIPLVALRRWETARSLAGTVAEEAPALVLAPPVATPAGRPRKAAA